MKKYIALAVLLCVFAGIVWFWNQKPPIRSSLVIYSCAQGKEIKAYYYTGSFREPKEGEMPTPPGMVRVVLSDGRETTLSQTLSASGLRYATTGESMIFWSKGDSVFIVENDIETYSGCAKR